jgi:predicted metal-binding protein
MAGEPKPRPASAADVRILICTTCRMAGGDPGARPGAVFAARLRDGLADPQIEGVSVETVECLSVCKRPCTVALTGAGRWSYVYGDLDPHSDIETLLSFARQYRDTPDGVVPWRERPEVIRKSVVARLPPSTPHSGTNT